MNIEVACLMRQTNSQRISNMPNPTQPNRMVNFNSLFKSVEFPINRRAKTIAMQRPVFNSDTIIIISILFVWFFYKQWTHVFHRNIGHIWRKRGKRRITNVFVFLLKTQTQSHGMKGNMKYQKYNIAIAKQLNSRQF